MLGLSNNTDAFEEGLTVCVVIPVIHHSNAKDTEIRRMLPGAGYDGTSITPPSNVHIYNT